MCLAGVAHERVAEDLFSFSLSSVTATALSDLSTLVQSSRKGVGSSYDDIYWQRQSWSSTRRNSRRPPQLDLLRRCQKKSWPILTWLSGSSVVLDGVTSKQSGAKSSCMSGLAEVRANHSFASPIIVVPAIFVPILHIPSTMHKIVRHSVWLSRNPVSSRKLAMSIIAHS